jgi:hypothetical protein
LVWIGQTIVFLGLVGDRYVPLAIGLVRILNVQKGHVLRSIRRLQQLDRINNTFHRPSISVQEQLRLVDPREKEKEECCIDEPNSFQIQHPTYTQKNWIGSKTSLNQIATSFSIRSETLDGSNYPQMQENLAKLKKIKKVKIIVIGQLVGTSLMLLAHIVSCSE